MEKLELVLTKHPFFQGLPEKYIRGIAGMAIIVKFEAGRTLFNAGEDADKFYLVISGKIAIETNAPQKGSITIQTVEAGEIVGWSWLVAPFKYRFGAKVLSKTEAIVINGVELRSECENDYWLGYELMKRMVQAVTTRLEQARLLALDVYGKK
jgi:CRP/FNR family cyclic AMP-dependent transcriptional regulator